MTQLIHVLSHLHRTVPIVCEPVANRKFYTLCARVLFLCHACVYACVFAYLRACMRACGVPGLYPKAFRCIELKVWDYDLGTFGANDFLGQVVLPLNVVAPKETCDRCVRRLLRTIMHLGSLHL